MNTVQNEMAILHALKAIEAHVSAMIGRASAGRQSEDAQALLGTVRQTITNTEILLANPVTAAAPRMHDLLSRAWEALEGEEESVKEEHADLIQEVSALLDELRGPDAAPVIHEYLFDVELLTAIRVKATSEAEARKLLKDYVDGTEANLGSWPDGDPILCQVAFDDDEHLLAEIDGQAV